MQIILSESDLDAMPAELQRSLLDFLLRAGAISKGAGPAENVISATTTVADGLAVLSRRHAIDLVREASFQPEGRIMLGVLKAFARRKGGEGPTRDELANAAGLRTVRLLERHLGALERIIHKTTGNKTLKLWRYISAGGRFRVHPATQQVLREVLQELSHAGEHEEVLWE